MVRIRKTAPLLVARPRKTRNRDISDVETAAASVLEYRSDPFEYLIHNTGRHDDASLVIEEDIVLAGPISRTSCHAYGVQGSSDVSALPLVDNPAMGASDQRLTASVILCVRWMPQQSAS